MTAPPLGLFGPGGGQNPAYRPAQILRPQVASMTRRKGELTQSVVNSSRVSPSISLSSLEMQSELMLTFIC